MFLKENFLQKIVLLLNFSALHVMPILYFSLSECLEQVCVREEEGEVETLGGSCWLHCICLVALSHESCSFILLNWTC